MRPAFTADLATIRQRQRLIVAVKDNLRPLGFRTSSGQLTGLEIDIARRLALEILGRDDAITLHPVLNRDRLPAVLEDRVDLVIARLTVTGPRARLVSFSTPYYIDGTGLITARHSIRHLKDLRNQPIAVLKNSTTIDTVRYFLPSAKLIGVDSYASALQLLQGGQAVAFAGDVTVLSGWAQEYSQYKILPTLLSAEPLCVVMPKGKQYDDLRRQVNGALDRWRKEGWLQERAEFWGLPVVVMQEGNSNLNVHR
ncbi:ABC transporter substrate-binding protein [Leptolyngbya sp. 'hensonii']|nr:ABC transporter substrate-binding protein [Leptolyngbya sp. 'hensonii']